MEKDWTGNKHSTYALLGASNHSETEREVNDFYATPAVAVEKLLSVESFEGSIWENACGVGSISEILEANGYKTFNTDLFDRGYLKQSGKFDFLKDDWNVIGMNIVTNPPYKYAEEFVKRGCKYLEAGMNSGFNRKMCLLLKLQFLEGQARKKLFEEYPPERIYVFSKRITCAMNAEFDKYKESGAQAYAWYVWTSNNKNNPIVYWI